MSLEQLDLLLLTVAKPRRVQQDGLRFQSLRYIDPTLAAYVGEDILIRYDPRDMAEIRVYHQGRFLCRAVCQELAGETVSLKEIIRARRRRIRDLRQQLAVRQSLIDQVVVSSGPAVAHTMPLPGTEGPPPPTIKRYLHD
jgi:putative transposase